MDATLTLYMKEGEAGAIHRIPGADRMTYTIGRGGPVDLLLRVSANGAARVVADDPTDLHADFLCAFPVAWPALDCCCCLAAVLPSFPRPVAATPRPVVAAPAGREFPS